VPLKNVPPAPSFANGRATLGKVPETFDLPVPVDQARVWGAWPAPLAIVWQLEALQELVVPEELT
jgi:hypothetical protein